MLVSGVTFLVLHDSKFCKSQLSEVCYAVPCSTFARKWVILGPGFYRLIATQMQFFVRTVTGKRVTKSNFNQPSFIISHS